MKRIRDTGTITLGVRETTVPFSYLDAQKQPLGYSVDLCLRIVDAVKAELKLPRLDVKYVPVTSSNRIPTLVEGKIDLECGSTTNTRDRQKQVAFAYTTFVAGIKMLAKKSANVNSIDDLRGQSVVVTKGTTSEKIVRTQNDERLLKINIIESKDHGESFKAVEEGRPSRFRWTMCCSTASSRNRRSRKTSPSSGAICRSSRMPSCFAATSRSSRRS